MFQLGTRIHPYNSTGFGRESPTEVGTAIPRGTLPAFVGRVRYVVRPKSLTPTLLLTVTVTVK